MHTSWFWASWVVAVCVSLAAEKAPAQPGKDPGSKLDQMWERLAARDPAVAYRAMWQLARSPEPAIAFMEKHMPLATAPDPKKVEQLIRDLASDRFAVRNKAQRELESLGTLVEPALRTSLAGNLALESRRRIERLLNLLARPVSSPKDLRELRSIETLEMIDSVEARKLLLKLAQGPPQSRLSLEAKETLKRHGRRQIPSPASPLKARGQTDLYGDPLPAGAVARLGSRRFRISSNFNTLKMAFSPDSKMLASMSNGLFQLWDARSGKLLRHIDAVAFGGKGVDHGLAFTPDGKWLAISAMDRQGPFIDLVNLVGGQDRHIRFPDKVSQSFLDFTPDGKILVAGNNDGSLRFWDLDTNKEVRRFFTGQGRFDAMGLSTALSPNGTQIAVPSRKGDSVDLWSWQAGNKPKQIKVSGPIVSLAISDKTLAAGSYEGLFLVDPATGRRLRRLPFRYSRGIAFSRDGKILAVTDYRLKRIVLLNSQSGEMVKAFAIALQPNAVVLSPDGRLLAASSGAVIHIWDLASGKPVGEQSQSHFGEIRHIEFSPTGNLIATASLDGTARLWEAESGKQRFVLRHQIPDPENSYSWVITSAFSPDGKRLATSSLDDTVRLWDTRTGRKIYQLAGHGRSGGNRALSFSADGRKLFSWGDDMYLRIWDVTKGKAIAEHRVRPKGIDISEDDDDDTSPINLARRERFLLFLGGGIISGPREVFALSSRMRFVHFFGVFNGKEERIYGADSGGGLALSPDGKRMLCRSFGQVPSLTLLNLPSGKMVAKMSLPATNGQAVFAADGKSFAAAVGPRIIVWETASAGVRLTLENFGGQARTLAFSPDGRYLTAGLDNATALVWDLGRATQAGN